MFRNPFSRLLAKPNRQSARRRSKRPTRFRFEALEPRAMMSVNGDFNGDGYDDLAVGISGEDLGSKNFAGAVSVIYGTRKGLHAKNEQFWHQDVPGVNGVAHAQERFGSALAIGDFNGDGYSDLAIGVPSETVNGKFNAGAVNILYGSKSGLRSLGDQLWTQDSSGIKDQAEEDDAFGSVLTAGDFNGDGRDDLAIGVRGEGIGSRVGAGLVHVLYGSKSGLTSSGNQVWNQDSSGINGKVEAFEAFGANLTAGDFNGDGRDDLAVGVPKDYISAAPQVGAVAVIYGSTKGLNSSGDQLWHQDSPGIPGTAEKNDDFGRGLAVGDFNRDGYDDLAVGVPHENNGQTGVVEIIYGSKSRLTGDGSKQFDPTSLGYTNYPFNQFGYSLATGDFDGDGFDDLAIGSLGDDIGNKDDSGSVYIVYGSSGGLTLAGKQQWHQDSPNLPYDPEPYDLFGIALTTGDYNGDGYVDLAVGIPGQSFGTEIQAGAVQIIYGFFFEGLTDVGNRYWYQGLLGLSEGSEASDYFGGALG